MKNDYEIAEVQVLGSAHDVIMGSKEPGPPYESDVDLYFIFLDDDE